MTISTRVATVVPWSWRLVEGERLECVLPMVEKGGVYTQTEEREH